MESYAGESDYLKELQVRAVLPDGFRCATTSIEFFPKERRVAQALPMNLALILLDEASPRFGGVFTRNRFPGAPVLIGRRRLTEDAIRGVLINNKISNVCTQRGEENAEALLTALGRHLDARPRSFFAASTGIIGWELPREEMENALPRLVARLDATSILPVARAIMTTDAFPKVRRAFVGSGSIVGIAKGAGMIDPNMATLLCFLCTDLDVPRDVLREELAWCVERSLNRISVDSDQSTSDMAIMLSSGRRGEVSRDELRAGLLAVLSGLALDIMRNAEGVGHVVRVQVTGATSEGAAVSVARAVVNSPLVKTAIFGNDPNVGRIVSAIGDHMGNTAETFEPQRMTLRMGGIDIFAGGRFLLDPGKEEVLSAYLKDRALDPRRTPWPQHDRTVDIEIGLGASLVRAEVLGSDLSYEYVRENADYRS
ncbi:MAG TPA: bifunctional ornithine acetyltransferase/N-acetylglutamate synthase [Spirochaetia bacterium]|nr:bifunctional ornithine acetyltransferase/N-acetylglutamate synthase [Spirochaetia bacterium]